MGGRTGKRGLQARLRTKRVYERPARSDGARILVDRLWPRGLSKASASISSWAKAVSPSNELRRWYGHEPSKWNEFRKRYFAELDANPEGVEELRRHLTGDGPVTFVFGSREERLNNAAALVEYLTQKKK